MKIFLITLAASAVVVIAAQWQAHGAAPSAVRVVQSPDGSSSHRVEEIADGVYFAIGTGSMTVMSNSLVIVNDDHVILVGTTVTPDVV